VWLDGQKISKSIQYVQRDTKPAQAALGFMRNKCMNGIPSSKSSRIEATARFWGCGQVGGHEVADGDLRSDSHGNRNDRLAPIGRHGGAESDRQKIMMGSSSSARKLTSSSPYQFVRVEGCEAGPNIAFSPTFSVRVEL
jgi:hypothetical protein